MSNFFYRHLQLFMLLGFIYYNLVLIIPYFLIESHLGENI
jgi:hypothetical protein